MTRYRHPVRYYDWHRLRHERRAARLERAIKDPRPSPLAIFLRVACVLVVVGGAVFWLLKGGR